MRWASSGFGCTASSVKLARGRSGLFMVLSSAIPTGLTALPGQQRPQSSAGDMSCFRTCQPDGGGEGRMTQGGAGANAGLPGPAPALPPVRMDEIAYAGGGNRLGQADTV